MFIKREKFSTNWGICQSPFDFSKILPPTFLRNNGGKNLRGQLVTNCNTRGYAILHFPQKFSRDFGRIERGGESFLQSPIREKSFHESGVCSVSL